MEKQKKKLKKVKDVVKIFFDSETYECDNEVHPYLIGGVTSLNLLQFEYSKPPHVEFLAKLTELSKKHRIELGAHNSQFDLLALMPQVLSVIPEITIKFSRNVENKCFLSFTMGSPTIKLRCYDTGVGNRQLSVDAYCKILKLPSKLAIDYNKTAVRFEGDRIIYTALGIEYNRPLSVELDYLKNDVMAMPFIHEYIYSLKAETNLIIERENMKRDPKTSPAFGKDTFNYSLQQMLALDNEDYLFDSIFRPVVDVYTYIDMQRSSCGGFSSFNKDVITVENKRVRSYDRNSAYPAHMSEPIPNGEMLDDKPQGPSFEWFGCCISECEGKEKYQCIATRFFPEKYFRTSRRPAVRFYTSREQYELLCETCEHDCEVLLIKYQVVTSYFKDLIAKLYHSKQTTEDPVIKMSVKLILNSLYGKMLEKTYNAVEMYNIVERCWDRIETPAAEIINRSCMTGVYIITRARSNLIRSLCREIDNGNTFLYCDTDSLKIIENNPVKFEVDNDILGAWKFEGAFTHYRNTKIVKKYFLYNAENPNQERQLKLSGINNKAVYQLDKHLTDEEIGPIFDLNNNYRFMSAKNIRTDSKYQQICISSIDISMNKNLKKVTHEVRFKTDKIIVTPVYDEKVKD